MSATNYPKLVYSRIWTLLLAHTPFTTAFPDGKRTRFDGTERDPRHETIGENNLPHATLFPPSINIGGFTSTPNYGHKLNHDPLTANDWAEIWTLNFRLEVIHRTLEFSPGSLQLMEIATALRKGGPKLGLAYVRRWGPLSAGAAVNSPPELYGESVWRHDLIIPVELFINGSDLVT